MGTYPPILEASTSTSSRPSEELSKWTNLSKTLKFINLYVDLRSRRVETKEGRPPPKASWFRPSQIRILQHKRSRRRPSCIWKHPWICWKISTQQETWILINIIRIKTIKIFTYSNFYLFYIKESLKGSFLKFSIPFLRVYILERIASTAILDPDFILVDAQLINKFY